MDEARRRMVNVFQQMQTFSTLHDKMWEQVQTSGRKHHPKNTGGVVMDSYTRRRRRIRRKKMMDWQKIVREEAREEIKEKERKNEQRIF